MSQQTAVEYLFHQLWDTPKDKLNWYAILREAKQMEKELIKEAFEQGVFEGTFTDINYQKCDAESEYYYNERYNK